METLRRKAGRHKGIPSSRSKMRNRGRHIPSKASRTLSKASNTRSRASNTHKIIPVRAHKGMVQTKPVGRPLLVGGWIGAAAQTSPKGVPPRAARREARALATRPIRFVPMLIAVQGLKGCRAEAICRGNHKRPGNVVQAMVGRALKVRPTIHKRRRANKSPIRCLPSKLLGIRRPTKVHTKRPAC